MYDKFWSESLNGRDRLEELGVDGKLILDQILEAGWNVLAGFIWIFPNRVS
jgi:hypothetical protein